MNIFDPTPARSPRQIELLDLLHTHRFATTDQLSRFSRVGYGSDKSALRQTQRHLSQLLEAGLVTELERRVGGWQGGSELTIWALTTSGLRHLKRGHRRLRPREVSTTFLGHTLAVTETCLRIEETVRELKTEAAEDSRFDAVILREPRSWRNYLGRQGIMETLRPDIEVTIHSPEFTDRYFIEVDRATENPARVLNTTKNYGAYQASGEEQKASGSFPALVWLVPTAKRQAQIRRYLSREPDLPSDFWLTLQLDELPSLVRDGPERFFGAPEDDQPPAG